MARRIAISTLNARTIDILNTIRQNASMEYQSLVPEVTTETDIPKVGEALLGYPALANQFVSSLINRIAFVKIKSATFNNAYAKFKKGYLEFGETIEEAFVQIAKAREFSAEKAEKREFKRTLPDVRAAFHVMNWRVQYPVTVQYEDIKMAFVNASGVTDMIAKITGSVITGAEYDEFLLFKYLLIKAIAHGKMYPVSFDSSEMTNAAKVFRGYSNELPFMKTKYNIAGVTTTTPKENQYIFMDAHYNAEYDVDVLARAFNMDKADFMGKLTLIDDFTTFDNERFDEIRKNSDMIEEVTAEELALMANVKAVLLDDEWFQVYDNLTVMTEAQVASGLYWNYFYNTWKTVSSSPFSNAIVFIDDSVTLEDPDSITVTVTGVSISDEAAVVTLMVGDEATLQNTQYKFIQTESATENLIAVHPYGAIIIPASAAESEFTLELKFGDTTYVLEELTAASFELGGELTFLPAE